MIPQYIRLVLPTNKNVQLLVPAQQPLLQGLRCIAPQPIRPNNSTGSVVQSQTASSSTQSNLVPVSSSSTLNVQQQIPQQTILTSTPTTSPLSDDVAMKQNNNDTSLSDISKFEIHCVEFIIIFRKYYF